MFIDNWASIKYNKKYVLLTKKYLKRDKKKSSCTQKVYYLKHQRKTFCSQSANSPSKFITFEALKITVI